MSRDKVRRLEHTVAAIQLQHGPRALRRARELRASFPPHIPTGFPALDAITGCGGVPLGALTLFGGRSTSGKFTVACKALAHVQAGIQYGIQYSIQQGARAGSAVATLRPPDVGTPPATVALLDLAKTADPDSLRRCGVQLSHLLITRPEHEDDGLALLLDIVQSGQVRLLVVDGTAELAAPRMHGRAHAGGTHAGRGLTLAAAGGRLRQLARATNTAVLFIDEPDPPWQQWQGRDPAAPLRRQAALQVEMVRERWLRRDGQLIGYAARAQVRRSLWRSDLPAAEFQIVFEGTTHGRPTW